MDDSVSSETFIAQALKRGSGSSEAHLTSFQPVLDEFGHIYNATRMT
jgi:hypothetical protein